MKLAQSTPYFILSFVALAGQTRVVAAEYVQRELFKMGYQWNGRSKDPRYLDSGCLHINQCLDAQLAYGSVPRPSKCRECEVKIFDAATDLNSFLVAVKREIAVEKVISGVKVTIYADKIDLDPSALLASVNAEAAQIQRNNFGS